MTDYKSMYYHLTGRMSGAVEALEAITASLKLSMQTTEDMFVNSEDDDSDEDGEEAK